MGKGNANHGKAEWLAANTLGTRYELLSQDRSLHRFAKAVPPVPPKPPMANCVLLGNSMDLCRDSRRLQNQSHLRSYFLNHCHFSPLNPLLFNPGSASFPSRPYGNNNLFLPLIPFHHGRRSLRETSAALHQSVAHVRLTSISY